MELDRRRRDGALVHARVPGHGAVPGRRLALDDPPRATPPAARRSRVWDFRAELGGIAAPTLVVVGAEDPATPPEQARAIADGIPGARLVVIPDAAHLANVEQPDAFNRAVLDHRRGAA